jgi:hypothetical protein
MSPLTEQDHLERALEFLEELEAMEADYWRNRDRRWEHSDHLSPYSAAQALWPWTAVRVGPEHPETGSSPVRRSDDPTIFDATVPPPWRGIEAPAPLPAAASPQSGVLPVPPVRGLAANASLTPSRKAKA